MRTIGTADVRARRHDCRARATGVGERNWRCRSNPTVLRIWRASDDPAGVVGTTERGPVEEGEVSGIDGVRWTSDTIPGVEIAWGDPVDLPLDDETAGLVMLHVPRFDETGRHHQLSVDAYLGWLDEVIDEAGRVLETGGRLVLVVKTFERGQPWLDLPAKLTDPLHRAGFTTPTTYIWCPTEVAVPEPVIGRPDGVDLTAAQPLRPMPSWRVLVAGKGHEHRAGSILARQELGLPHRSTIPAPMWDVATNEVWFIPFDQVLVQGNLPPLLVAVVLSLFSFVEDLIVNPLCGTGVVADIAGQMGRRARCYEPDERLLERLVAGMAGGRLGAPS